MLLVLSIQIYTIDKFRKEITVTGFATLAIFVTSGSEMQPVADSGGYQISLNTGAHQRRIFLDGPKTEKFSQDSINSGRVVPCSSILFRIVPAPRGPNGKTLQVGFNIIILKVIKKYDIAAIRCS